MGGIVGMKILPRRNLRRTTTTGPDGHRQYGQEISPWCYSVRGERGVAFLCILIVQNRESILVMAEEETKIKLCQYYETLHKLFVIP